MPQQPDFSDLPTDFSGSVRLFPLPNLVMFPHVMQPLHIFEMRYRAMLADALADDRLIAMALLDQTPGGTVAEPPPIGRVVCIGRVVSHAPQADGRSNILLFGLRRATIRRELPESRPYRQAETTLLSDLYPAGQQVARAALVRELGQRFRNQIRDPDTRGQVDQLMASDLPLGALTDIVAFTLDLELTLKQRLLEERNVDRRARLLLEQLASRPREPFPPPFSAN